MSQIFCTLAIIQEEATKSESHAAAPAEIPRAIHMRFRDITTHTSASEVQITAYAA